LRNALDAMEKQGHGGLWIDAEIDEPYVRIVMSDDGPGLAPEMQERLFTPFSSSRTKGLGLGLVISHDIVSALGGRLEEGEARKGGATCYVVLRLATDVRRDKESL